ncbi:MAG: hypothetical protein WDN69_02625 [Aliidongia sp.]
MPGIEREARGQQPLDRRPFGRVEMIVHLRCLDQQCHDGDMKVIRRTGRRGAAGQPFDDGIEHGGHDLLQRDAKAGWRHIVPRRRAIQGAAAPYRSIVARIQSA